VSKWYLGKVGDMEGMRWIEDLYAQPDKNGVRAQNTSPLPMIVFRHEKYRLVSV
jgi:hypothetical protein